MPRNFLSKLLTGTGEQEKHTTRYKVISTIMGVLFFMVLLPLILIGLAVMVRSRVTVDWRMVLTLTAIPVGAFFMLWAGVTIWLVGRGTPMPNAPTQNLIVSGPFKHCRNPIYFGATLYYLGLGACLDSVSTGLIVFFFTLIAAGIYLKFVEEKELEARFGEAYTQYKKRTPFFIPKWGSDLDT